MKTILVIDGCSIYAGFLNEMLEELGYHVIIFNELSESLSFFSENKVDLILLDAELSKESGLQALDFLKNDKLTLNIPVIIISSITDKSVISKSFEKGAVDYLSKPIDSREVEARIKNFFKILDLSNELIELEKTTAFNATVVTAHHTLNQPLTSIKGNLQLILQLHQSKLSKKVAKLLERSLLQVNEITGILNRLEKIQNPEYVKYEGKTDMINLD
jgi:DNA-binding response OmpR family regulator